MSGYVDIHAHVLPGIDDGPADLAGALAMARAASAAGTGTLAATPHLRSDFPNVHVDELSARCQAMSDAIAAEGIPLRLVGGAEVSLIWALEASPEDLALASYGRQGTDVLIETPSAELVSLQQHLYALRVKGPRITLAHPERSSEFQRDPGRLRELADQGILLQVNAESLLAADRRAPPRRLAEHLVSEGIAHVLASDGHRAADWRPVTKLARGVEAAALLIGPDRAEWMARDAPGAILAGLDLPAPPEVVTARRRRRFGRR